MFNFPRGQNALRSFLGLGPAQISLEDQARITHDIGYLLPMNTDQQFLTFNTPPTAPGTTGQNSIAFPTPGFWLIDRLSAESSGPVTSGTIELSMYIQTIRGANSGNMTLVPPTAWTKQAGGNARIGVLFPQPFLVFVPGGLVQPDAPTVNITNYAASVGNALANISCLCRRLELVGLPS